jgi:hypothetical protein
LRKLNERGSVKNPNLYSAFDIFESEKRANMLINNPKASKRAIADEIVWFWKVLPKYQK